MLKNINENIITSPYLPHINLNIKYLYAANKLYRYSALIYKYITVEV